MKRIYVLAGETHARVKSVRYRVEPQPGHMVRNATQKKCHLA